MTAPKDQSLREAIEQVIDELLDDPSVVKVPETTTLILKELSKRLPSEEELAERLYDKYGIGFDDEVNYATKRLAENIAKITLADIKEILE